MPIAIVLFKDTPIGENFYKKAYRRKTHKQGLSQKFFPTIFLTKFLCQEGGSMIGVLSKVFLIYSKQIANLLYGEEKSSTEKDCTCELFIIAVWKREKSDGS